MYIQLTWLNKDKIDAKHHSHLKQLLRDRECSSFEIVSTSRARLPKNSPLRKIHISLGGSDFMAFEKVFFKIVLCQSDKKTKKIWVKIVESVYRKTQYLIEEEIT